MEGTPQPGGGDTPAPSPGGNTGVEVKVASVDLKTIAWAFLGVGLSIVLAIVINEKVDQPTLTLKAGVSQFAAFYAFAQALERLLEPFALYRDSKPDSKPHKAKKALKRATVWRRAVEEGVTAALQSQPELNAAQTETHIYELETAIKGEENAAADAEKVRGERTVAYWAWATAIATVVSGLIGLYFLQSILDGVPKTASGQVKDWFRYLDIAFTGLVIGSGTKPLHDLIASLEKKSSDTATSTGSK